MKITNVSPPDKEGAIVFVTKYALTDGICQAVVEHSDEKYTWVWWSNCINNKQMFDNEDCHSTIEAATARVLEMIEKKRASLEKALKKLDKLKATIDLQ